MWILRSVTDVDGRTWLFRLPWGATRVIGRAPGADFIIEAPLVSRLHCRLGATSPDRLEVIDLDSTNGTFVNDKRIFKGTASHGDTLRVGRVELTVSQEH